MHSEIVADIPMVLRSLAINGYEPVHSEYSDSAFGNYFVELNGPKGAIRIVRDRGQYFLESGTHVLSALSDRFKFGHQVIHWLESP